MAGVVYLDVDDEITSAAARIRGARDARLAIVVPYGSRLASSRINFRLLAREAQSRGRRLSVVAPDRAARALAASAGLPVFGTVDEYEEAEAQSAARGEPDGDGGSAVVAPTPQGASAGLSSAAAERQATPRRMGREAAGPEPRADGAGPEQRTDGPGARFEETTVMPTVPPPAATAAAPATTAAPVTAAAAPGGVSGASARPARPGAAPGRPAVGASAAVAPRAVAGAGPSDAGVGILVRRRPAWPWGRTAAIALLAALGLGLLAVGVAAYVLLPSAEITVTTRLERIGPVALEIRADPDASGVDAGRGAIPARRLTIDVATSGTFPSSGQRVEASRATGRVTFLSKDPVSENEIAAGARVSTPNGIRFQTTERVVIPKATIVGLTIVPGEASTPIRAAEAGPRGNVEANAITVIPPGEDPTFTEVRNPRPTSGGRRRVFPLVTQEDVDRAMEQLRAQLAAEFEAAVGDPSRVPAGHRLFPETQRLGDPQPTVDPGSLVDQEIPEFELGLSASGTVVAVDDGPVEAIARTRVEAALERGHRLVQGSVRIERGEPTVEGEVVTFPVTATASQLRVVDAETLREEVKGMPLAQARALLDRYGNVELDVWPAWVSAIPTIDSRLILRVETPAGAGGLPAPTPRRTLPASAAPAPTDSRPGSPEPAP